MTNAIFYEQINSKNSPPKEATVKFWNNLWGTPKHFNRRLSRLSLLDSNTAEMVNGRPAM